ncbi:MAG: hypothetical protein KGJ72_09825 [Gammaproteobacteria bacterium]|nr:hypothetical protein [Gammaproteobacteria bacterium]
MVCAAWQSCALAATSPYPRMAPLDRYLMAADAEVALARSAAPRSISAGAEVLVLRRSGYEPVAKGGNGFVCLVERSWGAATGDPDFWNPRVRGPLCLNPPAVRTVLPIYLMKTKLVLAGKPKEEIVRALAAAFAGRELPPLEPGAMSYMLAKRQYLGDEPKSWHPHLMFFVSGDAVRSWGADLPGSPVMAANDPEERMTIFFVWVGNWSDGTPAPRALHQPGAAG